MCGGQGSVRTVVHSSALAQQSPIWTPSDPPQPQAAPGCPRHACPRRRPRLAGGRVRVSATAWPLAPVFRSRMQWTRKLCALLLRHLPGTAGAATRGRQGRRCVGSDLQSKHSGRIRQYDHRPPRCGAGLCLCVFRRLRLMHPGALCHFHLFSLLAREARELHYGKLWRLANEDRSERTERKNQGGGRECVTSVSLRTVLARASPRNVERSVYYI